MILQSFFLFQSFRFHRKISLEEVEPAYRPTAACLALDSANSVYFANYWRHELWKVSHDGHVLFPVGSAGQGPGEYRKPRGITLIHGESQLLVVSEGEKVQIFSTVDGSFVRTLVPFYPANGWLDAGDHFLALQGPGEDLLDVINPDGEKISSWMRGPAVSKGRVERLEMCFALDRQGTAYVNYGILPVLHVAASRQPTAQEWAISVPNHYREPPTNALSLEHRYDRDKMEAYFTSFSHVSKIFVLPESDVLLVAWLLHEPVPYAVEAYDLNTRQRVLANFHPRGRPVCSRGELLACEEILEDEEGELLAHNLVLYRYQPGSQP